MKKHGRSPGGPYRSDFSVEYCKHPALSALARTIQLSDKVTAGCKLLMVAVINRALLDAAKGHKDAQAWLRGEDMPEQLAFFFAEQGGFELEEVCEVLGIRKEALV